MAYEVTCSACGTANEAGRKFCGECGAGLALACPACGSANTPGVKFCGECGTALTTAASTATAAVTPAAAGPAAERRLVSVLFADLVGFTTLSESRDAEEVRDLLSRYFDTCRRLIELYGGTVEKFIGDAVMATWGTPTATEDDAERAVRAALDLVTAVSALGDEVGAPDLRARAGVLTGEAAVTLGAEGQGMVAGDMVNTAARIQSAAEPGAVLVGDSTRRASEVTIAYAPAGEHELKGKAEPMQLWQALRVTSGRQGSLRAAGLEAPFVGRDSELRRIKDLFHACAEERRAHLLSVTGIGGIGKSRLAWEFEKYVDGVTLDAYWHRGRCLSYGDGVTYWALADMVRMRCRIAEDESAETGLAKLRSTLDEHLLDGEERRYVEPHLAQLLGFGGQASADRQELFAGWRLFFERLADVYPTILVFEDVQWADASLLDFVEHLLEWSRSTPLFVLTLARPELHDRRPAWGAGHRNFASLYLEPLPREAMTELLAGLVPGLAEAVQEEILSRAEGIPLYAVETVRMLLDRGLLVRDGDAYHPTAEIHDLDVPETLHALIAARLDGLALEERRLLQDAAVLGKTFAPDGVAALSGLATDELEPLLAALVRKEVLTVEADPRSPEHGQYGFLQDLVRHVAYEMLSRKERRARHLAAAAHLESVFPDGDEIAEVLAAHYLDAHMAHPDADDAAEVVGKAATALERAGERAQALGAPGEAQRHFTRAAEIADDARRRASLLGRAGDNAGRVADFQEAERLFAASAEDFTSVGDTHAAARRTGDRAGAIWQQGRQVEAMALAEEAWATVAADEQDEDTAWIARGLATGYFFTGDAERATEFAETALRVAESLGVHELLVQSLMVKGMISSGRGNAEESVALKKHALELALAHEIWEPARTLYFNLSDGCFRRDQLGQALSYLDEALALSRRRGVRTGEWAVLAERSYPLYQLGRWDEALASAAEIPEEHLHDATTASILSGVVEVHVHRADLAAARRTLSLFSAYEESTDVQDRACYLGAAAAVLRGEARHADAVSAGMEAVELAEAYVGLDFQGLKQGLVEAIESALALGELGRAAELVAKIDGIPPGHRAPSLTAHADRFRARLAGNDPAADGAFASAETRFEELGMVFWRAVTQLEHAEWLLAQGRGDEAAGLLDEARDIFERLRATPWLERVDVAVGSEVVV